ncbi:uncharacterized protein LOC118490107 isoform X1 [Helianthus annuus]|uniref:uncharacterized protein LOC118490107 isoform X1 n=1 Tax=Helianthus annuus TaxID=4232 RepID=UPI001652C967|nr:uncharacterized protein LOC118490107 isoform X1 [Helianthus annuus]
MSLCLPTSSKLFSLFKTPILSQNPSTPPPPPLRHHLLRRPPLIRHHLHLFRRPPLLRHHLHFRHHLLRRPPPAPALLHLHSATTSTSDTHLLRHHLHLRFKHHRSHHIDLHLLLCSPTSPVAKRGSLILAWNKKKKFISS